MTQNKQVAIILNGVAGGGKGHTIWNKIKPLVEVDYPEQYTMATTERAGHAKELAQQFIEQGYQLLVAIGGDGTINQVANGYMLANGKERGVAMAVMSGGTGGDFIRTLNIHEQSAEEAWRSICKGENKLIDVGLVKYTPITTKSSCEEKREQAFFINICSLGMTADVVKNVESHSRIKKLSRSFAYWIQGVLTHLPYYPLQPVTLGWTLPIPRGNTLKGEHDDGTDREATVNVIEERVALYFAAICNGQYFGGGMRVAPEADLSNGQFQLVRVRDINLYHAVTRIIPGLKEGRVLKEAGPTKAISTSCIKFTADTDDMSDVTGKTTTLVEVDGEFVGTLPLEASIIPQAILLRVPSVPVNTIE
ncbi:ATP-NAD kinase-like domain-containing protein [Syncephalis plumigaleata]|nr:ATP-NAD kinase-like domain-containing protein [Syncephalis plumigaleata]